MTLFRLCFFLLLSTISLAQPVERLRSLGTRPATNLNEFDRQAKQNQALSLPFRDDFSYERSFPNPNLWSEAQVYINRTWAKSPISLGVATFDGLNEFGRPYKINGGDSACDHLSSQIIDLSNPQDSVYLSFFYQAGGWGEPPAAGDDSLTVQFWDGADTVWRSIWNNAGQLPSEFEQVMIPVADRYHRSDFRFRIVNYGNRRGALDIWHLDYLRLDDQRNRNDTLIGDIAFTRPHPSLLRNYEAMPWWHLNGVPNPQSLAKPDLRLHYRRNIIPGQSGNARQLGEYRISLNGSVVDQNGLPDGDLDDLHQDFVETRFPVPDTADLGRPRLSFLQPPYNDEFTLLSEQYYSGGSETYTANDTLRKRQVFANYYAYDDGSAERAYEVLNNRDGFIVQRYDVLANDTLKGLQVYFQPAAYDIEGREFSLIVLDNQQGLPGSIIWESDSLYTIDYQDPNFYATYLIDSSVGGVFTQGTVFIGIRQQGPNPLSIGYDQNNRNMTTTFYGEVGDMYQSFLEGTLMMRPIYGYVPRDLSLPANKIRREAHQPEVYPNPSSGHLRIDWPEQEAWEEAKLRLFDLRGRCVAQAQKRQEWNLSYLNPGIYLITFEGQQVQFQQKIIIQ